MKKITGILFVMIFLYTNVVLAQKVEGNMSVTGFSKDGLIKETTPIDLFKSFKEGKYKVSFFFKSDINEGKGIVLFDLKTTVKKDGKTIANTVRKGWPWFPGEMFFPGDLFVPIEAFDVIPALQSISNERSLSIKSRGNLPPGKYEISLEMVPTATWVADMEKELVPRGKIIPGYISFIVK